MKVWWKIRYVSDLIFVKLTIFSKGAKFDVIDIIDPISPQILTGTDVINIAIQNGMKLYNINISSLVLITAMYKLISMIDSTNPIKMRLISIKPMIVLILPKMLLMTIS